VQKQQKKQIPCGDDNKKDNGNNKKDNGNSQRRQQGTPEAVAS